MLANDLIYMRFGVANLPSELQVRPALAPTKLGNEPNRKVELVSQLGLSEDAHAFSMPLQMDRREALRCIRRASRRRCSRRTVIGA